MDETKFVHDLPKSKMRQLSKHSISKASSINCNHAYDNDLEDGYKTVIDVPSFVDFMLVNELCSNSDVYQSSTFFHKGDKMKNCVEPVKFG
jgi:hypothetical protein